MDGLRPLSFPDPGQQATIRVLGNVADDAVLLSGRAGGQTILQGVTLEGGVVVNDLGADVDFRVESATNENALFVDGATGQVGMGGVPTEALTLIGTTTQKTFLIRTTTGDARHELRTSNSRYQLIASGAIDQFSIFDVGSSTRPFRILGQNIGLHGISFGGGVGVLFLANRTTAPGSAPVGGVIPYAHPVATGKSNLLVKNEAGETTRLTGVDARVTADFNRGNATLTNVTGLTFDVEAGKTYSFVARIYSNADSIGGQKYAMGGTCTATAYMSHVRIFHDNTADHFLKVCAQQPTFGGENGTTNAAGPCYVEIGGTITVNAAGTLTVQFAQVTASNTSTVLRGSTFHLREIT